MNREVWLGIAMAMACAMAFGCTNDVRGGDQRGNLGKACTTDADCGGSLFCDTSDPLHGLCTETCSDTDECQLQYGLGSFCIGANRCVRECVLDTDCLDATACDSEFSWCR